LLRNTDTLGGKRKRPLRIAILDAAAKTAIIVYGKRTGTTLNLCTDMGRQVWELLAKSPTLLQGRNKNVQAWNSIIIAAVRPLAIVYTGVAAVAIVWVAKLPAARAAPSGTTKTLDSALSKSTLRQQGKPAIEYRNLQYGFCFTLPEDWREYSIVIDRWRGYANGPRGDVIVQQGPTISIRDPRWTSAEPRQDIPLMVFTHKQWRSLQRGEFAVSPAPFGPAELGRNRRYVFGLPPRYNYAFPPGFQEVDQILRSKPLDGDCLTHEHATRAMGR